MLNVIKEYLVSLGYRVDQPSFNSAVNSVTQLSKTINSFASASIGRLTSAGLVLTGFMSTFAAVLYRLTIGVANADLQNELFARRMWMAKDAAVSYKSALSALGVTLQDLYLSPELMQKFFQLRQQATSMEVPDSFSDSMKGLRAITFEFQRFKLEATYAVQWVGYYLTKYLSGPLFGVKGGLKGINDLITSEMPKWTNKVAQFIANFVHLGNTAYTAGKEIKEVWNSLGDSTKQVIGLTASFFALLKLGPIGMMVAGLTALLLLLDDYTTFQNNGKSAFPDMWKWVEDFKKSVKDDGTLREFKKSFDELAESILGVWINFWKLMDSLVEGDSKKKLIIGMINAITESFKILSFTLDNIAKSLKLIRDYWNGDENAVKEGKKDIIDGILKKPSWLDKFAATFLAPLSTGYYPISTKQMSRETNMVVNSNNYIYGASNPQSVALVVNRTYEKATRQLQGVII